MKKSLSLLVAIAMVFSMFATVAAAATDTQSKYDELKEAGVFRGTGDGSAALENEMTRAEFAGIIARLTGVSSSDPADFNDVPSTHWATKDINAVVEAGFMQGDGFGNFKPSANVTLQELIIVAVRILGLEVDEDATVEGKAAAWAQPYIAAAEAAGLIQPLGDYTVNATRGDLVDVTYEVYQVLQTIAKVTGVEVVSAKKVVVSFSDGGEVEVELEEALQPGKNTITVTYNDREYTVDVNFEGLAISKVAQTGAGEITVSFNRAVDASEKADLTFEVRDELISYTITTGWSEDNKSAILTSNYLPAGEYEVVVGEFDPEKVTIVDERAAKIEITANSLQKAANQSLGIKLYNQFGKEMDTSDLDVRVYNATRGWEIHDDDNDGKYDLSGTIGDDDEDIAKVDDTIIVTVTHPSGVSTSKTFKVVAGSAATKIVLGEIKPLEGKSRISAGDDDLVLPYELIDQYGTKITLPETDEEELDDETRSFSIGGIEFILSRAGIVGAYEVDEDGVLKLDFVDAGTLTINAVNPATGASASTVVVVQGAAKIKTFQMSKPNTLIAAGEEVKIPFTALDTYGDKVAAKDIKLGNDDGELEINPTVAFAAGYPKINGKGELVVKWDPAVITNDRTVFIYAYVDGVQVGRLENLSVKKAKSPVKVNGVKDVPKYFTVGAEAEFDKDNVTYLDNYNRTHGFDSNADFTVVSSNTSVVEYDGTNLVAKAVGKAEITVNFDAGFADPSDKTRYKFTVEVVKDEDVKSYEIKSIGTIYGDATHAATSKYAKKVELVGKLSNGSEVAIVQNEAFDFVTTSNATVAGVGQDNGQWKVFGLDEGEVTITAYKGGTKLAEQTVTVSEAAPVPTKVSFSDAEYSLTVGGTLNFTINDNPNKITVEDQYGVAITPSAHILVSSDTDIVTVNNATLTITAVAPGQATITFITSNNVQASAVVIVTSA